MLIDEIAKEHNLTLKQLSADSNIAYTTLMSMKDSSILDWKSQYIDAVSKALATDIKKLAEKEVLTPFIKWVGGKRQLLNELKKYVPDDFGTYYEPFIGGGALFLNLQPDKAVINDFNPELTNLWRVVKSQPEELVELLRTHQINNSKEYYLDLRLMDRDGRIVSMSEVERAARFMYMNKTGFNGLWRVNSKGQNNVPYGKYANPTIVSPMIIPINKYLSEKNVKIKTGDYQEVVTTAETGDFVYFDPPYIPASSTSVFTSYTANGFGLVQQEQLRDTALKLAKRGVRVMLSNADVPLIEELYSDSLFEIHHVQATRAINSKSSARGKVGEVIITAGLRKRD
ncbi:adenine-specific DNA methyltransferase [Weissella oryzae SG25]|uniref:Site-specific DNA-methyltransferase (adenine-specific) n=1 Tax=Weissella oryzae (strain DSM 25784 / JCM 18191 / LMG 30913 / SG25) TaxID=1329250 RepID=A0A069CT25_WEIOS|nr:DNA adenine methylase [Weissella oryzae]GAK30970.1 adenine-specific DNA methyltransferase [Weissella oryzae SG25]